MPTLCPMAPAVAEAMECAKHAALGGTGMCTESLVSWVLQMHAVGWASVVIWAAACKLSRGARRLSSPVMGLAARQR
eukprot:9468425-Pyramimonas_sp.AAC.1